MTLTFRTLVGTTVLISMLGCASVSVQKLDRSTGKVVDGAAEGLRFYLPRPYVSVFEPFVISSEVFLARGELSPDSTYVLLTQVPTGLAAIINEDLAKGRQTSMGDLKVDATQVRVAERGGAAQAAAVPTSPASAASSPEASKPDVKSGILNYKATNDNGAYAMTPQPRYFNILWLPDFDEQYVVSAKAGLGNAGVVIGFGQGWSLQSLDATVDNSAIVKPLLDFYSGTLGSLQKLATARIEGPLGALTGGPQSANAASQNANATSFKGGTQVTVKVTKVRIVAPGLYPILKPKEIDGVKLDKEQAQRILAPVPPLTNIAFNTYDVVVIEAARATGDSALRMQQYVDTAASGSSAGKGSDTSATDGGPTTKALGDLRIELSKPENATTGKDYFVPAIGRDASGAITVTLTKTGGGPTGTLAALPDDAMLKTKVTTVLKAAGATVSSDQITIKR